MKVDFFIIGAPKAGTTSLYYYLSEHPQIQMSSQKETDYFSSQNIQNQGMYYRRNRVSTLEKYKSLFTQKEGVIYGEASVSYMYYDTVANDIKKYNPNAKIIVILRNPIDRAFSHYLMDYRLGLVSDSFEKIINRQSKHQYASLFYQQYVLVSKYYEQLKRYFDVFDREQILVLDYQDFKTETSKTLESVYKFLDIDIDYLANTATRHNTFSMPKNAIIRFFYSIVGFRKLFNIFFSEKMKEVVRVKLFRAGEKPKISLETKQQLKQLFRDDIYRVSKLIDKDLIEWIK